MWTFQRSFLYQWKKENQYQVFIFLSCWHRIFWSPRDHERDVDILRSLVSTASLIPGASPERGMSRVWFSDCVMFLSINAISVHLSLEGTLRTLKSPAPVFILWIMDLNVRCWREYESRWWWITLWWLNIGGIETDVHISIHSEWAVIAKFEGD